MKFVGEVGFQVDEKGTELGVWNPVFLERKYIGDVLRSRRSYSLTDKQNVDLEVNNQISILSDLYAQQNWNSIRYVIWNGVKWQVSSVDLSFPRLTLELGGVYNENETREKK